MTGSTALHAFTAAGAVVLRLSTQDWAAFNALPRLPLDADADVPAGFVPPGVAVVDQDSGTRWEVSRHPCGSQCGCAAWPSSRSAESLTATRVWGR